MSTRRRLRSGGANPRMPRSAFTLIELLVVVAIIAVLISILLPSLAAAREQGRTVVCASQLGGLGRGLHTYFNENSEWIPGVNTSGIALRAAMGSITAMYQSKMPVQSYDWITPSIANSVELPSVRSKRFREILNRYRCPSQAQLTSTIFDLPACQDRGDFDPNDRWTTLSYLMPVHFQFWGQRYSSNVIAYSRINPALALNARVSSASWEAYSQTYRSRAFEVGSPSGKVAAADGTRYLDLRSNANTLDFEAAPGPGNQASPSEFGSFTSAGAWFGGDTSYGVKAGTRNWTGQPMSYNTPGQGKNLELSYRHGPRRGAGASGSCQANEGKINAMTFDGAVRLMNDRTSRSVTLWYPRGSKVHELNNTMMQEVPVDWEIP
jgi:prepilin-type N-terminal cleavage/methylation domain-containing protein